MRRRWNIRIGMVLLFVVLMLAGIILAGSRTVEGARQPREKRFTSIQVKKGDSLWSIAKERMSPEYGSVQEYIEEVCETNHIYDEVITEDMYLVIPYYTGKE
jgi:hypothetical protein